VEFCLWESQSSMRLLQTFTKHVKERGRLLWRAYLHPSRVEILLPPEPEAAGLQLCWGRHSRLLPML